MAYDIINKHIKAFFVITLKKKKKKKKIMLQLYKIKYVVDIININ